MKLAEKYWAKKAFITVGDYFQSGGEFYTRDELITKIENDLGCSKQESIQLINKCEERGFITHIGGNIFTR